MITSESEGLCVSLKIPKMTDEELAKKMAPGLDIILHLVEMEGKGRTDPMMSSIIESWKKTIRPQLSETIPDDVLQRITKSYDDFMKTRDPKELKVPSKLTFEYHFDMKTMKPAWSQTIIADIKSIINQMRENEMEGHVIFK